MLSASCGRISAHQRGRASRGAAARARSRNQILPAAHSCRGTPPSILFPLPPTPAQRQCKSLSSENRLPAAPSPVQFVRIPRSPVSFPTRRFPQAGPGSSLAKSLIVPAPRPRPAAVLRPSSESRQNPRWFHPAPQGYSSQRRPASCMPPHRYCRIPPPHSPQSAVSAHPAKVLRSPFPSANKLTLLYPSPAVSNPAAADARLVPSIPRRSFLPGFSAPTQTAHALQTLSVSSSAPLRNFGKITLAHPRAPSLSWRCARSPTLTIVPGAPAIARPMNPGLLHELTKLLGEDSVLHKLEDLFLY